MNLKRASESQKSKRISSFLSLHILLQILLLEKKKMDTMPQQLCYVSCNFCGIVLAVHVPWSKLLDSVAIRCGRCSNIWSVNVATAAGFQVQTPEHTLQFLHSYQTMDCFSSNEYKVGFGCSSRTLSRTFTTNRSEQGIRNQPYATTAPEKKRRLPSAYNQFIKEEIQRIKANNPQISHRQAFSTAAKNWAQFPRIHFGLMLENISTTQLNEGSEEHQPQEQPI